MLYYVMSSQHDAFDNPYIARYDEDKFVLSNKPPKVMPDNVMDKSGDDLTIEEWVEFVDYMRTLPPTGMLLIIPKWVGQYLRKNHPAFQPISTDSPI